MEKIEIKKKIQYFIDEKKKKTIYFKSLGTAIVTFWLNNVFEILWH